MSNADIKLALKGGLIAVAVLAAFFGAVTSLAMLFTHYPGVGFLFLILLTFVFGAVVSIKTKSM